MHVHVELTKAEADALLRQQITYGPDDGLLQSAHDKLRAAVAAAKRES